jgi:hypothetical protein
VSHQVVERLACHNPREHVGRGNTGDELQVACIVRGRPVLGAVAEQREQPGPVLLREQTHPAWTPRLGANQDQLVPPKITIRSVEVPARVPDVDRQLILGGRGEPH